MAAVLLLIIRMLSVEGGLVSSYVSETVPHVEPGAYPTRGELKQAGHKLRGERVNSTTCPPRKFRTQPRRKAQWVCQPVRSPRTLVSQPVVNVTDQESAFSPWQRHCTPQKGRGWTEQTHGSRLDPVSRQKQNKGPRAKDAIDGG